MRICNLLWYLRLVRWGYQSKNWGFGVDDASHSFCQIEKVCTTFQKVFPSCAEIGKSKLKSKPKKIIFFQISLCVCTEAHVDDVVAITSSIFDVQKVVPRHASNGWH